MSLEYFFFHVKQIHFDWLQSSMEESNTYEIVVFKMFFWLQACDT
jgi:hypothetical protein